MQQHTKQLGTYGKILLTIFVFAAIAWFGAIVMRAVIGNEFFVSGTLEFDPRITLSQEQMLFQLITAASYVVLISYLVVLISGILLLFNLPLTFKNNGWLLIACILFFAFVPVEIFTAYLDTKFIILWERTKYMLARMDPAFYETQSTILRGTLSHRIGALRGVPVIAILSYVTAIAFIVWQPLKRTPEEGS